MQGRWGIPDAAIGGVVWFVLSNVLGLVVLVALAAAGTIELRADMDTADIMEVAGLWLLVATAVAGLVGFVGWTWIVGRWKGTGSLRHDQGLAFRWVDLGWGLAGGVASLVISMIIGVLWVVITGDAEAPTNTDDILGEQSIGLGAALVMLLAVGIAVPFAEEVFFRGLLLGSLRKRWGVWSAAVVSSLVFGSLHALSGGGLTEGLFVASVTALFGMVFALLRVLTGRLGPAIVAHMLNNSVSVVVVVASQWGG